MQLLRCFIRAWDVGEWGFFWWCGRWGCLGAFLVLRGGVRRGGEGGEEGRGER